MPEFSQLSKDRLSTCDPLLVLLFSKVVENFDCAILEGTRNKERQDKFFAEGKSKVQWPNGAHNKVPSKAVDVAPYPINWNDKERFYYFSGFVKGMASALGIGIRWGGDWDNDTEVIDQTFNDLVHFELVKI